MTKGRKQSLVPIGAACAFAILGLAAPTQLRSQSTTRLIQLPDRPEADLAVLRIWTCTNLELERALGVSADGRWLSYASADTGELMVRDLVKRRSHCLVRVAPQDVWLRMASSSLVSPDGSQVAYAWRQVEKPIQLRVIGRDRKRDRLLYQSKDVSWLAPACWSADSSQVITVVPHQKEGQSFKQVLLLSARDGSVRVIKSFPADYPDPEGLSLDPTGRYLAYDIESGKETPEHAIHLLSTRSGHDTVVLGGAADNRFLGWSPDGRNLLFRSNCKSGMDAWLQRVEDGKPQGDPQRLKPNLGKVIPLGTVRNGGFCYGVDLISTEVQIAKLDWASGEFVSPPKALTGKDRGHDSEPCWSPDGKQLAYISQKDDSRLLHVRSNDSGEERPYSPAIGFFYAPAWSADGKSILLHATPKNGGTGKFRLDLATGEAQQMKVGEVFSLPFTNQSFTVRRDPGKKQILVKHRDTGEEQVVYQGGANESLGGMQTSPDGENIAFMSNLGEGGVWRRMVKVVSSHGGEARELIGGTNYLSGFAWYPDSRRLLCCGHLEACVLSLDGQPPRKLKACFEGYNLSINPDGQQVAFVTWDFSAELWLMENAFPPSRQVRKPVVSP